MDVIRRISVVSTMDECHSLFAHGAREFTAVVADVQTGGRGRVGRTWFSPPGSAIYASVLLTPAIAPRRANQLTMLGALCVLDAIEPHLRADVAAGIKWPNDVLVGARKLAGVLVESSLLGDALEYCVLGIGINIHVNFTDAPEDVRARACSLHEHAAQPVERAVVEARLLDAVEHRYGAFLQDAESLLSAYRARLLTLGADVCVGEVAGRALHVEDDGALVVRTAEGERIVRFGDLV